MQKKKNNVPKEVQEAQESNKEKKKGKKEKVKKNWKLQSKDGAVFSFFPVFEYSKENDFVDCELVEVEIENKDGTTAKHTFHYLELYLFIYFCANESIKRTLEMRYERKIKHIPYDVSFKLTKEEMDSGIAKRRIELQMDEVQWFIAKQEAMEMIKNMGPQNIVKRGYNK